MQSGFHNLSSLDKLKKEVQLSRTQETHGTVVIKPQFFSNFHIVNIDNVIPFMGNNNSQVTVSQANNPKIASELDSRTQAPNQNTSSNLPEQNRPAPGIPNNKEKSRLGNLLGSYQPKNSRNSKERPTTLQHPNQKKQAQAKKNHNRSESDTKSLDSMILGSQRSPNTKKDLHVSTRMGHGKNSPQSRISNKKFGTSFDGFSDVSKINDTFQADVENVEFEVRPQI